MAASLAKLCLAVALALPRGALGTEPSSEPPEGPLPFMPSVGVALYNGCENKTAQIHDDVAIGELHGQPCSKVDTDRLADLGVDSCAGTASKISSLV